MSQKFYICSHCGNIIAFVKDKGVPVICCGEKMKEIIPGTTDAAVEKHVPVISQEGNIVTEIEKIVKSEKCDLIIVGNKGLGAVTRFLLGSVSNKLAQHSNCSLLIVK